MQASACQVVVVVKDERYSGEPVVVVKVVELTTRVRVPKSKPAGGVGDKQC